MAITWGWIKPLKLRNKLAITYTVAFTILLGLSFLFIYYVSEKNREEEFYKRLSDRTITKFKIVVQVSQIDNTTLRIFDRNTINSLSDEKTLIFDSSGKLLYNSIDDTKIDYATSILYNLKNEETYKTVDGSYELLGVRFTDNGSTYYGITKAYDLFGKRKIQFLGLVLLITFAAVTAIVIIISRYLSNIITRPIMLLTRQVENISPGNLSSRVGSEFPGDEVGFLADRFNGLLDKLEDAFKFQNHYIHHLSHELKTPLAIMMTSAERALTEKSIEDLKASMQFQKNAIMELSHIINAMLDIVKTENKLGAGGTPIRIDEVLFEAMDEIRFLNHDCQFEFTIAPNLTESNLTISGNIRMIKMAVINLLKNAVNFSSSGRAEVSMSTAGGQVAIHVINDGDTIDAEDRAKLFKHLFRGKNSAPVKGFGLGLVLAHRVVILHGGTISYSIDIDGNNRFTLQLPASM